MLGREGGLVRLSLDPRHALVRTKAQEDRLAQALSRYYGTNVRIEIDVGAAPGAETPAQAEQRASTEQLEAARAGLENDPTVLALKERFGARLLPDTVKPIK
jgi:DNA polymerase-3 subunit gamma/tau